MGKGECETEQVMKRGKPTSKDDLSHFHAIIKSKYSSVDYISVFIHCFIYIYNIFYKKIEAGICEILRIKRSLRKLKYKSKK